MCGVFLCSLKVPFLPSQLVSAERRLFSGFAWEIIGLFLLAWPEVMFCLHPAWAFRRRGLCIYERGLHERLQRDRRHARELHRCHPRKGRVDQNGLRRCPKCLVSKVESAGKGCGQDFFCTCFAPFPRPSDTLSRSYSCFRSSFVWEGVPAAHLDVKRLSRSGLALLSPRCPLS